MKSSGFKPVTNVIFDMDGLLLNTEELYFIAFQNICTPYGKVFTFDMKSQLMGQKIEICAEHIVKHLNLPITVKQFLDTMDREFYGIFSEAKMMPGAKRLVSHLRKHNIPMAVCTGSSEKAYRIKTENHEDLFKLFGHKVFCGSDPEVKHGKPHPEAYEITRSRFRPNVPTAECCLVFEDSPSGVEAAVGANMQCVMVPDARLKKEFRTKATQVIASLHDFKPELFGLPPFNQPNYPLPNV